MFHSKTSHILTKISQKKKQFSELNQILVMQYLYFVYHFYLTSWISQTVILLHPQCAFICTVYKQQTIHQEVK